jgi:hypothetical protein
MVKLNATLAKLVATNIKALRREYKEIFAWNYTDLKRIPPRIAQHRIKLKTIIPHVHQAKYGMNPTYVKVIKQNLDKFLNVRFIVPTGEASWLSPIVIIREKTTSSKYAWIFDNSMLLPKKSISFTFYSKGVGRSGRARGLFVFYQIFYYHQIMITFKNMYKTHSSLIGENSFQ